MLSRRLNLFLFPLLLFVFGYGLVALFELRFDQGDFYAPYSSLRADPIGTRALFEAIEQTDDLASTRLYGTLDTLDSGKNSTVFMLGTGPGAFRWVRNKSVRQIEQFLHEGGRIVFSLQPTARRSYWDERHEKRVNERRKKLKEEFREREVSKKNGPRKESETTDDRTASEDEQDLPATDLDEDENFREWLDDRVTFSLLSELGVAIKWKNLDLDADDNAIPESAHRGTDAPANLQNSIAIHTAAVFDTAADDDWRVIYTRQGEPVIIERMIGSGSVVFCADSYFFSNEAMREDRDLALVDWFMGGATRIVFSEGHLGVKNTEGVATLGRKYRLHGLVSGLAVLALLFIWKNATSLVPPLEDAVTTGTAVTGRESGSGFVNLLRRTVSPAILIGTCLQQWRQSNPHHCADIKALESIATRENQQRASVAVVKKYREICELLKHRR